MRHSQYCQTSTKNAKLLSVLAVNPNKSSIFAENITDMKEKQVQYLLICRCFSPEHQLILSYFPEDDDVYATVHLREFSFWQRLVHGIKYIFGHKSIYGAFDEFIFNPEDYSKVQDVADHLRKAYEKAK